MVSSWSEPPKGTCSTTIVTPSAAASSQSGPRTSACQAMAFSAEKAIAWHAEVLGPLCEEAAALGVTIVVEHVPFGGSDQLETIAALLDRVPSLRFHLDSGHAKLERRQD